MGLFDQQKPPQGPIASIHTGSGNQDQQMAMNGAPPSLFPPPPPQATPPGAGFDQWKMDPMNQAKIMPSLTAPDKPVAPQPNEIAAAKPAFMSPPQTQPPAFMSPPVQTGMPSIPQAPGAKVNPATQVQDQANNPQLYGKTIQGDWKDHKVGNILSMLAAGALGAGGGLHGNPGAGAEYAGNVMAHDQGVKAGNAATYESRFPNQPQDLAKLADTNSQTAERTAKGNKENAQGDAYAPITLDADMAEAIGHPELENHQMDSRTYKALAVGHDANVTHASIADNNNTTSTNNNAANNATKVTTTGMNNATSAGNNAATNATRSANNTASNATRMQIHDTPGAGKPGAPAKPGKPNSDEQKRADLARNANDNLTQLDDILKRRPDLFGPVGGRMTEAKNALGTSDPDVAALETIKHNLGMVGQSAHGMRSAMGVEAQAKALLNNFHNTPEATRAASQTMRQSVGTFLNDETNRNAGNPPNTVPGSAMANPPQQETRTYQGHTYVKGPQGWHLQQ